MKRKKRSAAEQLLDQAIELTFPASDPIAVDSARRRAQREAKTPEPQNTALPPGTKPPARKGRTKRGSA